MKVRNNQPRLVNLGGHVNLAPGVNEVADLLWLKATHMPGKVLTHYFSEKHIEVLEHPKAEATKAFEASVGKKPAAAPGAPSAETAAVVAGVPATGDAKTGGTSGLSHLTPKEARELISDTFDRDTLASWANSETRKAVQDALAEQLELTKVAGDPPKKK